MRQVIIVGVCALGDALAFVAEGQVRDGSATEALKLAQSIKKEEDRAFALALIAAALPD